jgi:hypothetical protein
VGFLLYLGRWGYGMPTLAHIDYWRPDTCPPLVTGPDGITQLRRFRVEAVIYAKDRGEAQRDLSAARMFLAAGRIMRNTEGA